MAVKVQHITKVYRKQKALDDVSFEVQRAQVVGFLGPNGAGKSTMMKIITCFLPPTSGAVSVCGFDVMEESIEVRKNVGYLPEHNPLYLEMFVKEYLMFIAGLHGIKNNALSRVKEMIEMTGLQIEQNKKIGALSKGYRQRVGLAQALLHNPQVLILDEPTSGLDPNQLTEIRNLIKEIGKEKTVILSTHIMQEVEAVCDRVIVIHQGQIVADDKTTILQQSTSGENSIVVEFDKVITKEKLGNLEGIMSIESLSDNRWRIKTKATKDIRVELFQFAVANELAVLTMQKEEQSLEDIFHRLTIGH